MINMVLARRQTLHRESLILEALVRLPLGNQKDAKSGPDSDVFLSNRDTQLSGDV